MQMWSGNPVRDRKGRGTGDRSWKIALSPFALKGSECCKKKIFESYLNIDFQERFIIIAIQSAFLGFQKGSNPSSHPRLVKKEFLHFLFDPPKQKTTPPIFIAAV